MVFAQEHQLAINFDEAPPIGHVAVHAPFLKTENGTVWRVVVKDADIAGFIKMRDAALGIEPGVQFLAAVSLIISRGTMNTSSPPGFKWRMHFSMKNRKRLLRASNNSDFRLFSC
jgi:hypothetical protein